MTFLDKLDVGGQQYRISNSIPMGTCATPAGTEVKECAFADSFQLSAGNLIAVTFTYANTYGDGSTTYPKLLVQGVQYPVKIPTGTYAGDGAWVNGQAITFMFDGTNLLMTTTPVTDVVASNNMYSVTSGAVAELLGTQYDDSDFNDITSQVTTALGANSVFAFRKNNIVILKIDGTYSGSPTTTTQVFISNMPTKYRPEYAQYCCGLAYLAGAGSIVYPARITVRNNGQIEMSETAFPTNALMRIGIMYLV